MTEKKRQHEMIKAAKALAKKLGKIPTRAKFIKDTGFSDHSLRYVYPSYYALLEAAGLRDDGKVPKETKKRKPKIILLDLETLPNLLEALKVWPQLSDWPGRTLKATITSIICGGWKELGKSKTNCINAWDFKNWKQNVNDDSEICKAIYEVLKDADCVITHNGKRFDWKYLQTRLKLNGLDFLPKIPHVDTKELASRNLFSFNNRLTYLGEHFVKDKKMETGGWSLWVDVWHKKKTALQKMSKYCKQDVDLLEKLFEELRPFASQLPNFNLFTEEINVCPSCGSVDLKNSGERLTTTKRYKRYRCKVCKAYSRTNLKDAEPRQI